jgi:hypothetical protein
VPDFLAEPVGNTVQADFQSLDNVLLPGKYLPPLLAPQFAFLPPLLP